MVKGAERMPPRGLGNQDDNPKGAERMPPRGPGNQDDNPNPTSKNWLCTRTEKKGDRGFIEGCLFALCCCWLCEACF